MEKPFYIGQKVVCVDDEGGTHLAVKKGQIYTVLDMLYHPVCENKWEVGFATDDKKRLPLYCKCAPLPCGPYKYAFARRFAPIQSVRVSAIPELLKAPVEERVDIISR